MLYIMIYNKDYTLRQVYNVSENYTLYYYILVYNKIEPHYSNLLYSSNYVYWAV